MDFIKLPSNSEKILLELVQSDNPTNTLSSRYKSTKGREKDELDGIIRELKENGFIQVKWASNLPYFVALNNSAKNYFNQVSERKQLMENQKTSSIVFISHRSIDKDIADMILDFLIGMGIPRDKVFCSSLPGNDINEKISDEVKTALKNSIVNIAILSSDYYQSAFCLNEAGVFWYSDTPVIPIALPEIEPDKMYGFLDSNYKLRKLDAETDVSYLYDTICEKLGIAPAKTSIFSVESNKLREKYTEYLTKRSTDIFDKGVLQSFHTSEITTDDEKIVLYYILSKAVRKIAKKDVVHWLNAEEIYNVNVDNAFDLLSSFDDGKVVGDTLEFGIQAFRKYSTQSSDLLPNLKSCVEQHTILAINTFQTLCPSFTTTMFLFVGYIIEQKMSTFGDRWSADAQIKDIKAWETKNNLECTLSSNYGSCLEEFIQNDLVYASSWTSYGNVREYTLCPSLNDYLFKEPPELADLIQQAKNENQSELPF